MAECNNIDDFKLIKLYEERPLLWDTRLSEYYAASEIKVKLWEEIADLLGAPKGNVLILLSPKYCYRVIASVKFKCLFWPVMNCIIHNSTLDECS